MRTEPTHTLTADEIMAVTHVVAECGRTWRDDLMNMWMNDAYQRYIDTRSKPDMRGILQALRNTAGGFDAVERFKITVKAAKEAEAARLAAKKVA